MTDDAPTVEGAANPLADLIARLEAATGPSRELDEAISVWLHNAANPGGRVVLWVAMPRPYTSSLDAAVTLVPEGHWWSAGACQRENHATVAPEGVDDDRSHEGYGATVALALVIAALKARSATP